MLAVLSPAKTLDYESDIRPDAIQREPQLMGDTSALIEVTRKLRAADLKSLMGISDKLADLNVARFKDFSTPFDQVNARPAMDAFKGDVYVGLDAPSMDVPTRAFADKHIRMLSGLYGLLRPLDLMQAYRLEMGTKLANPRGENLYDFWGDKIADLLADELQGHKTPLIVNLASNEYWKAVRQKALPSEINGQPLRVLSCQFKELKDGQPKIVSFYAKKARGLMARFIADEKIETAEGLKAFDREGYGFSESLSSESEWVFIRAQ